MAQMERPSAVANLLATTFLSLFVILVLALSPIAARVYSFDRKHSDSHVISANKNQPHLVSLDDIDYVLKVDSGHSTTSGQNYTPVIFWHGMGDTARGSVIIDRLALEKKFPGIKVFSIQIGETSVQDELAGYFGNVNQQIDGVCKEILNNEVIKASGSINTIGFSQGAQFLRALVQRCPLRENGIRVKSLISLGGQHQGVFGLPNCFSTNFCDYIRHMLSTEAYESYVQEHLVQAEYWHDPMHEDDYKSKNIFLPDINNENKVNQAYKDNLLALQNFVLVKFTEDEMVVPRDSSHFAFYVPGQNKDIRPLEESALYQEDKLGLRKLAETGRLKLMELPGGHLHYNMSWFLEEIAAKYLNN